MQIQLVFGYINKNYQMINFQLKTQLFWKIQPDGNILYDYY